MTKTLEQVIETLQDWSANPHDRLVKSVFSDVEEAAEFLKAFLPESVTELLRWEELQLTDKEYVDETFRKSESDLLYEVPFKDEDRSAQVYVLFEHQSNPDRWMSFRVLKYLCHIWDDSFLRDSKQKHLPPVIPLVFYQGKSAWNYSAAFADVVAFPPSWKSWVPDFEYLLLDQSQASPESFKGGQKGLLLQLLMKAAFHGDFESTWRQAERLLSELSSSGGLDFQEIFITYCLITKPEEAITILRDASRLSTGETLMQGVEYFINQGQEQGMLKGIEQGMLDDAIEMVIEALEERFGVIPLSDINEIRQVDRRETLKELHKQAIRCEDIERFQKVMSQLKDS